MCNHDSLRIRFRLSRKRLCALQFQSHRSCSWRLASSAQNVDMCDEREMFDCLKCRRDICHKTIMIIPSQNTAFMLTPALTSLNFSMVPSPPREITWRPLSMRNIYHWVLQTGRKCCCSKAPMHWNKYFFQSKNRSVFINFSDNQEPITRSVQFPYF